MFVTKIGKPSIFAIAAPPAMSSAGSIVISSPTMFDKVIPIFRMFDVAKAKEFYLDYLGFRIDFEHRFEGVSPLYMGISRDGFSLHLSEHYGDGTPGSVVAVWTKDVHAFHAELTAKQYGYLRPGVQRQPWGDEMTVIDPFSNRIRFLQRVEA